MLILSDNGVLYIWFSISWLITINVDCLFVNILFPLQCVLKTSFCDDWWLHSLGIKFVPRLPTFLVGFFNSCRYNSYGAVEFSRFLNPVNVVFSSWSFLAISCFWTFLFPIMMSRVVCFWTKLAIIKNCSEIKISVIVVYLFRFSYTQCSVVWQSCLFLNTLFPLQCVLRTRAFVVTDDNIPLGSNLCQDYPLLWLEFWNHVGKAHMEE